MSRRTADGRIIGQKHPPGGFCVFCWVGLLVLLLVIGFMVASFGFLIYGGIWWGRLRNGPEHASGRPRQFWQTTLAMWICSLVLPAPAPWICSCLLAAWTTKSGCEKFDKELKAVPDSDPHYQRIQDWITDCSVKSRDDCIGYICSGEPHQLILAFAILQGIGIPAMVLYLFTRIRRRLR